MIVRNINTRKFLLKNHPFLEGIIESSCLVVSIIRKVLTSNLGSQINEVPQSFLPRFPHSPKHIPISCINYATIEYFHFLSSSSFSIILPIDSLEPEILSELLNHMSTKHNK